MPASRTLLVLAALTTTGGAAFAFYRLRRVRRALAAERAARRLTDRLQERDLEAFSGRLRAAVYAQVTLAEAQRVLDTALASHFPEGGPR